MYESTKFNFGQICSFSLRKDVNDASVSVKFATKKSTPKVHCRNVACHLTPDGRGAILNFKLLSV